MIPATIPYVGAVALAKAVGVSTAGLSAIELSNAIAQKIQENPEVLNTPQAKGIAFAMGINLPGVFAPDAEEIDRTRKEIQEGLKPGETSPPIDQGPIVLGGSEPPKIETTEALPIAKGVGPIKEQFPNEFEKANKAIVNYSKDVPENFKELMGRSEGKEKVQKAADALFDDDIFEDVLDTRDLNNIRQLEDRDVGDILD